MEERNERGQSLSEFLADYDENKYRRPSVTVDMAVFTLLSEAEGGGLGVLLIQRGDHPFLHSWALPGGFVNMEESLEDAAKRELREETGLTGLLLKQCGAFGAPARDPRTRIITVAYYALAPARTLAPKAGDDAAAAALFRVSLKLRVQSPSAEVFRLGLTNGETTIATDVKRVFHPMGYCIVPGPAMAGGGERLAGDHALILFEALCALNEQPRRQSAALIGKGMGSGEAKKAEAALGELFHSLK